MAQQSPPFSTDQIVALLLQVIPYGIYIVSFIKFCLIWNRLGQTPSGISSRPGNGCLYSLALLVFVFASVDVAFDLYNFVTASQSSSNPNEKDPHIWVDTVKAVEYVASMLVGDLLLVYLYYFIWDRSKSIIILPILLIEAQTAVGIAVIYFQVVSLQDSDSDLPRENSIVRTLETAMLVLNVITNMSINMAVLRGTYRPKVTASIMRAQSSPRLLPYRSCQSLQIDDVYDPVPQSSTLRSKPILSLSPVTSLSNTVLPYKGSPIPSPTSSYHTCPSIPLRPSTDSRLFEDSRWGSTEQKPKLGKNLYLHPNAQVDFAVLPRRISLSKTRINSTYSQDIGVPFTGDNYGHELENAHDKSPSSRSQLHTFVLLVQSGVLVSTSGLLFLILHLVQSHAQDIMWDITIQIIAITATFVIIQCVKASSSRQNENIHFSLSPCDTKAPEPCLNRPSIFVSPDSPPPSPHSPTTPPSSPCSSHTPLPRYQSQPSSPLSRTFSDKEYNASSSSMPASPSTAYVRSSYRPSLGLPSLPLRSEGAAARLGFYESLRLGTHLPGSSTPGSRFSVSDHGDSLRLSGVLAGFDPTGQKDNVTAEKHNLGWKLLKPFHRKHGKDMHEMVSTAENSVSVQNGFTSLPPRHGMEVEDRHVLDAVIRSSDIYREGDFGHEREMRNPASVSQTPPTSESQLDVIYQTPPAFPAPVHHQPGLIIPPPRQRPRIPEAFRLNLEQRSWPDVEASQLGTLEKGKSRSSPSMSSGYIADNGPFSCNGSSSPNLVMGMRHPDTILSRTQPALGARTRGQELRNDTGSSTSQHDDMNDWMPLDGTGDQYKGTAGTSLVALAADADSRFDELDLESTTKEAYLDQYIARFYENRRYGQCGLEEQL